MKTSEAACAICGELMEQTDGWFIFVENQWTDRLKILFWNRTLAATEGARSACSASHVQQLVVHWMTMGSLDFAFADLPLARQRKTISRVKVFNQPETDVTSARILGELAVHRESLRRVLAENPASLAAILEALTTALTSEHPEPSTKQETDEKAELFTV
jgi:hypothetical protein